MSICTLYFCIIEKEEISRELEQIKFRESNFTLNQEIVLELLLNFFLHKNNNPFNKIYFRFVFNFNGKIFLSTMEVEVKGKVLQQLEQYIK